jgi:3-isopropylmalate/(R)-2-methylmalate dehydratase small subunit
MQAAQIGANARITVDLEKQVVIAPTRQEFSFEIDPFRRRLLLEGLDDIGQTLQRASRIADYESARRMREPWQPTITV